MVLEDPLALLDAVPVHPCSNARSSWGVTLLGGFQGILFVKCRGSMFNGEHGQPSSFLVGLAHSECLREDTMGP